VLSYTPQIANLHYIANGNYMEKSEAEVALEELNDKEKEIYDLLEISKEESVEELRETLTDLDSGSALRRSVIHESFGALAWSFEPQRELAGLSFSEVRKGVPKDFLTKPFLKVSLAGDGLTAALAIGLYLSGILGEIASIVLFVGISSILTGVLAKRLVSIRKKIEKATDRFRKLDENISEFIERFGGSEEPFRLCDIDRAMKSIEDEGYEFSNELKARISHLREAHANDPIGSVMV
jgi:hypothetical protein